MFLCSCPEIIGGVEVVIHSFLTQERSGSERSASYTDHFTERTIVFLWIGNWVVSRAALKDTIYNRKICYSYWKLKHNYLPVHPLAQPLCDYSLRVHLRCYVWSINAFVRITLMMFIIAVFFGPNPPIFLASFWFGFVIIWPFSRISIRLYMFARFHPIRNCDSWLCSWSVKIRCPWIHRLKFQKILCRFDCDGGDRKLVQNVCGF